ncbi:hypothetical protein BDD43_4204 [Mucilaginibacter gracilis]|uniref:Uncharacterized protein n=1 Tax=Mucilaginibacter gracilis TaxID=423350 RepID=A0A495J6D7_9SPHI|nr:hypothetical protein BDD43_4204 [Mucilaginibacter gracilis]
MAKPRILAPADCFSANKFVAIMYAFSQSRNSHFPLLADFEYKREVTRKYSVYNEEYGEWVNHNALPLRQLRFINRHIIIL